MTLEGSTRAPLVLSYYGDDFTGSTDVMEALELAGVPTVLFLDAPTKDQLAAHGDAAAVGVAGVARTMSPEEMDIQLPPILTSIRALGARIFHYKVCSTFDSSPEVGSIGHAAEILRAVFGPAPMPLVVGVPVLGRYTAFGHLFATAAGPVRRIDRHPTMSVHPMTPMTESDLLRHLSAQTALPTTLVDLRTMGGLDEEVDRGVDLALESGAALVLLDVLDALTQRQAGRTLDRIARDRAAAGEALVVVGSSGVEYALRDLWRGERGEPPEAPRAVAQTLVLAGSRAPATDAQIAFALESGFADVPVDAEALTDEGRQDAATDEVVERTVAAWAQGRSVLVRTPPKRKDAEVDGTALAMALGRVAAGVLARVEARRLVVAGGDTSGLVARALGIQALRLIQPLAPGAPLCRASSTDPRFDGLELCLKAGQIGSPDYFVRVAGLGS